MRPVDAFLTGVYIAFGTLAAIFTAAAGVGIARWFGIRRRPRNARGMR